MLHGAQFLPTFQERLYEAETRDEYRDLLEAEYEATVAAEGRAKADERLFVWIMTHTYTLTAVSELSADESVRVVIERIRLERSGVDARGRWQKRQGLPGFVWLSPDGTSGRFKEGLPEDVDPKEIIEIPRAESIVTVQDRLLALLDVLDHEFPAGSEPDDLAQARHWGRSAHAAASSSGRTAAWNRLRTVAASCGLGGSELLGYEATSENLEVEATNLHREFHAEGVIAGAGIALARLDMALRPQDAALASQAMLAAASMKDASDAVGKALNVVFGRQASAAVDAAATSLVAMTDERIEAALSADDWVGHHGQLHDAAPPAFAAMGMLERLRYETADLDKATRIRRRLNVAKEKHARIEGAFNNSMMNLFSDAFRVHRDEVQHLFEDRGLDEAQQKVAELVELCYFYPRYLKGELLTQRSRYTNEVGAE